MGAGYENWIDYNVGWLDGARQVAHKVLQTVACEFRGVCWLHVAFDHQDPLKGAVDAKRGHRVVAHAGGSVGVAGVAVWGLEVAKNEPARRRQVAQCFAASLPP